MQAVFSVSIYVSFSCVTTIFGVFMPLFAQQAFDGDLTLVAMLLSLPMVIACFAYPVICWMNSVFGRWMPFSVLLISLTAAGFYLCAFLFFEWRGLFIFFAVLTGSIATIFISWLRENIALRTGKFGLVRAVNCAFIATLLYLVPGVSNVASNLPLLLSSAWMVISFIFFYFGGNYNEFRSVYRKTDKGRFRYDFWRLLPYCLVLAANTPLDLYGAVEWSKMGISPSEISLFWGIGLFSEFFVFYFIRQLHSELIFVVIVVVFSVLRWALLLRGGDPVVIGFAQLLHGFTYALPLIISMKSISKAENSGMLVAKFLNFQFATQAVAMLVAGFVFKYFSISPWIVAISFVLIGGAAWFVQFIGNDDSAFS